MNRPVITSAAVLALFAIAIGVACAELLESEQAVRRSASVDAGAPSGRKPALAWVRCQRGEPKLTITAADGGEHRALVSCPEETGGKARFAITCPRAPSFAKLDRGLEVSCK